MKSVENAIAMKQTIKHTFNYFVISLSMYSHTHRILPETIAIRQKFHGNTCISREKLVWTKQNTHKNTNKIHYKKTDYLKESVEVPGRTT